MIQKRRRGFTLIELMIAIVIIGILAAIAIPNYSRYMQRSRIVDATNQLSTFRVQLEQFFQDNRNYDSDADGCGNDIGNLASDFFIYSCASSDGTDRTFLLTAEGRGAMDGFTFTLDHENNQATTEFQGVAAVSSCWIMRPGDTC